MSVLFLRQPRTLPGLYLRHMSIPTEYEQPRMLFFTRASLYSVPYMLHLLRTSLLPPLLRPPTVLMGVLCWIAILPAPMRVSNIATFARYHGVVATAVEMGGRHRQSAWPPTSAWPGLQHAPQSSGLAASLHAPLSALFSCSSRRP